MRSLTQGWGAFAPEFHRYDLAPECLAEQIIRQRRAEGKVPVR